MPNTSTKLRIVVRATALATGEARIKNIYNVYDFSRASSSPASNKSNVVTPFKTAILTPLAACLSVSYIKAFVDVRWLDDPLDPFLTVADGVNGTVTGDSLPSRTSVTMQLKTGVRGRNYRGFKHYGPIGESHSLLDYLTSAAITLWGTFQTAYLAGFTESGGGPTWVPWVTAQSLSIFNPSTASVVGTNVTSTIVNAYLGDMKRRAQTTR